MRPPPALLVLRPPPAPSMTVPRGALGGRIYVDGSCVPSVIRGLARAACAVVELGAAGLPRRIATAHVPRHLPQTPQAAEYLGLAIGIGVVKRAASIIGDCLNVIRDANRPLSQCLSARRMYGGLVVAFTRDPGCRKLVKDIRWTKAHREEGNAADASDAMDIRGNFLADEAAKAAIADHAPLGPEAAAAVSYYTRRAPLVVKAVTAALELFPRAPGNMKRLPRPTSATQAAARDLHHWEFAAGTWRCARCNDWVNSRRLRPARARERCTGKSIVDEAPDQARGGHALAHATAELPFTFCSRCGAWGNKRARKLKLRCGAATPAGVQALSRIRRGWHPLQRRGPDGRPLPRERVQVTACFDSERSEWVNIEAQCGTVGAPPPPHAASPRTDAAAIADDALDDPMQMEPALMPPEAFVGCDRDLSMEVDAEEDVFGHGGQLEQPSEDQGRARTQAHASATRATRDAARRKRRADSLALAQSFTARAIVNAAWGSRPPSGDGSERLRRVRQRVLARCDAEQGREGRHEPAGHGVDRGPDVPGDPPPAVPEGFGRHALRDHETDGGGRHQGSPGDHRGDGHARVPPPPAVLHRGRLRPDQRDRLGGPTGEAHQCRGGVEADVCEEGPSVAARPRRGGEGPRVTEEVDLNKGSNAARVIFANPCAVDLPSLVSDSDLDPGGRALGGSLSAVRDDPPRIVDGAADERDRLQLDRGGSIGTGQSRRRPRGEDYDQGEDPRWHSEQAGAAIPTADYRAHKRCRVAAARDFGSTRNAGTSLEVSAGSGPGIGLRGAGLERAREMVAVRASRDLLLRALRRPEAELEPSALGASASGLGSRDISGRESGLDEVPSRARGTRSASSATVPPFMDEARVRSVYSATAEHHTAVSDAAAAAAARSASDRHPRRHHVARRRMVGKQPPLGLSAADSDDANVVLDTLPASSGPASSASPARASFAPCGRPPG